MATFESPGFISWRIGYAVAFVVCVFGISWAILSKVESLKEIRMEHIFLRQWRDSDLDPYADMNCDPEVMQYFPALMSREQSEASLARQSALIEQRGWGLWALDVNDTFAGFVGLAVPNFDTPFTPCVEVGWRLRREYWGRGVAYRGAVQALDYGFGVLKLPEIVSFTATANVRSRRLMERLGFVYDRMSDFEHPSVPEGHELRHHVLYRKHACA
jgi:RimJ/RimL family protein N-acetyltransferase